MSIVSDINEGMFSKMVPLGPINAKMDEEAEKARSEINDKIEVQESSIGEISK